MPAPPPQFASHTDSLDFAALTSAGFATIVHRDAVGSTMDEARALADDPATRLPAIVVADRQAAGRGRRGAGWWQARGALATSIVIDGGTAGSPQPIWALACGVAVAEAIRVLEPDIEPVVRWPNDIEVAGRKLAGMLVETAAHGRAVIGIGVNTSGSVAQAPTAISQRVVTIPDLVGHPLERTALLAMFLPRFQDLIATVGRDPAALLPRFRPLCALEGRIVTLHAGAERHTGLCRGIAADGSLVLDTPAGRREFVTGSLTDPADVWTGEEK